MYGLLTPARVEIIARELFPGRYFSGECEVDCPTCAMLRREWLETMEHVRRALEKAFA